MLTYPKVRIEVFHFRFGLPLLGLSPPRGRLPVPLAGSPEAVQGRMSCLLPSPGVGAPVRTAPALAKLRFRGRPLWKTAPRRKQSPSIHSAFVKQVFPPLVFGSSMISEHEVSDPRPRPTERYSGSTERNRPPPPLNRLFSSPLSCRVRRTRCWGQPPQCSRCSHPASTLKPDEPELCLPRGSCECRVVSMRRLRLPPYRLPADMPPPAMGKFDQDFT